MPSAAARRRPRQGGTPAPTREVILDTAERLFAARGVEGVAVRDLAREMGITASSLYNHFPGKRALYDAVLERGLGPIVEAVAVAWQDGLRPERVHATLARLTAHLARHPHLARLLQRALLEDPPTVQALLERWIGSLYREGIAVVRKAARDAGWEAEQVPHLGVALFGMIFAYFTNAAALRRLAGWRDDLFSARALAVQRRFLEQAILRLLGPRPRRLATRRPRRPYG
ncbi:MAG TPA: TetR/AcrR family transcriptional regulator [Verrucomicrobiae bacterium]|nr:TetR/AcrR family transcriptional regulator [Verrucomicrobiae bacterium]